jgi:uncharacterized protein (DUF2236 family)
MVRPPRQEGLFARDAVVRRVDAESILLLGGGRALLMQLAHPSVAAGVADHSAYADDPLARLRRTLEATYTAVFGTREQARAVARHVAGIHRRVTGPGYRATDPELLLWVHATLVDTAMRVHARFLRPLAEAEAEQYYQESKRIGSLFGVPRSSHPETMADFRAYVRDMVSTLEVSDTARQVAHGVLHPDLTPLAEPALLLARQLTAGLLPPPLRHQYGLSWDPPRQVALLAAGLASRQVLSRLPGPLRRVVTPPFRPAA